MPFGEREAVALRVRWVFDQQHPPVERGDNVGDRQGDEIVQIYVRDQTASVTRPIKELKGFERVTLAPGETRTVRILLGPDAFSLWNLDMEEVVEPGLFDIMVGPDSETLQAVTLEII